MNKPKNLSRRIGGTLAKVHETQKRILFCQKHGIKNDKAEEEELERIKRLEKLEQEREEI